MESCTTLFTLNVLEKQIKSNLINQPTRLTGTLLLQGISSNTSGFRTYFYTSSMNFADSAVRSLDKLQVILLK